MFPRFCKPGGGLMSSELLTLFIAFIWKEQDERTKTRSWSSGSQKWMSKTEQRTQERIRKSEKCFAVSWHSPLPPFSHFVFRSHAILSPLSHTHFIVKGSQGAITCFAGGWSWCFCLRLVIQVLVFAVRVGEWEESRVQKAQFSGTNNRGHSRIGRVH